MPQEPIDTKSRPQGPPEGLQIRETRDPPTPGQPDPRTRIPRLIDRLLLEALMEKENPNVIRRKEGEQS